MEERPFTPPPDQPAAFTGTMRVDADKVIRGVLTDVFSAAIHFEATKEGAVYHLRGWRGGTPEVARIPLVEDVRADGLPDDAPNGPCSVCEGRLFWRASVILGGGHGVWHCAACTPADSALWLDGVVVHRAKKGKV